MKVNGVFVKRAIKSAGMFINKNAPTIAAGVAIATMVSAVATAIKAAPKVVDMLDRAEIEKNSDAIEAHTSEGAVLEIVPLSRKEKLAIYAKCYWPTLLLIALSSTCMIGSVYFGNKQTKALAVLCSAAENTLQEYKDSVKDVVGEKKARDIVDDVNKKRVEKNQPTEETIYVTGHGNTLCLEPISGRYFRSSIEYVKSVINDLNAELIDVGFVTLNDYYYALGLRETKYGTSQGWNYNAGFMYGKTIKVDYTSVVADLNGVSEPAFVIDIKTEPIFDWKVD